MRTRNLGPLPLHENIPTDQQHKLQIEKLHARQDWFLGMKTGERLLRHHTLSSARRTRDWLSVSEDRLDLALGASYHHARDVFVPPGYCYLQPETTGEETKKVLRNVLPDLFERTYEHQHPLQVREHAQRNLAHEVKPEPCSDHLVLTRPNYHRRQDGAFFKV